MTIRKKTSKNLVEVTVPMPDLSLTKTAETMLESAKKIKITSQAQYEDAAATLLKLAVRETEIDDMRTTLKKPINQAATTVQNLFRPSLKFLEEAKEVIKKEMGSYYQRQEQLRLGAQRKANDDAAAERQRLLEAASKSRKKSVKESFEAAAQNVAVVEIEVAAPVA